MYAFCFASFRGGERMAFYFIRVIMKRSVCAKLCVCFTLLFLLGGYSTSGNPSFASDIKSDSLVKDTLTRLKVLKSKKWVELIEHEILGGLKRRMDGDIMRFSDTRVVYTMTYFESIPEGVTKEFLFYLSNTQDKVFDHGKLGTPNGKYFIVKAWERWEGTRADDTYVFEILELTPTMFKFRRIAQHNEVIIGAPLIIKYEGREIEFLKPLPLKNLKK